MGAAVTGKWKKEEKNIPNIWSITGSVTRLGNVLDFGQLFKAGATISLPKYTTFLGNFCKGVKVFNFSSEIIFGQLL